MFDGTILQQGKFTATGSSKTLKLRSDVDWMVVYNLSETAATNNGYGYKYSWQSDMGTTGLMEYHPAANHTSAVNTIASAFTVIDSSTYESGPWIAVTGGTNATTPTYTTASTTGLFYEGIVRLKGTDHTNLNGMDFTVGEVVTNTSFRLENALATAPGVVAGAAGYYKLVAPNRETYELFIPGIRYISKISVDSITKAEIHTLVDNNDGLGNEGYSIGQKVRFKIPEAFGMVELDGRVGTITSITTAGYFIVNIDVSGMTPFKYPTAAEFTAAGALTYASVTPIGLTASPIDSPYSTATVLHGDAIRNQGYKGIILKGGTTGPAGNNTNVIYWIAGKSFNL